jgi:ketosteroid isomerase-like protein
MSQENIEIVRATLAAVNRGDFKAAFSHAAPDAEADLSRAIGLDRSVYSMDQFRELMEEFDASWESVRYEFQAVIDAGEYVVTPFENRVSGRGGIELLAHGTWLWTIRGGAIVRLCLYQERHEAFEAAGLREQAMSQENMEVVRSAYAAFSERDLDALAELTDPNWVFDFSRSIGLEKGVYRGHEQVFRFAATNVEAFERFELSPIEYRVGPGGKIVVRHHVSAKGRGSGLEWERVPDASLVWELRNGKVITTTLYQHRSDALEAVGLRE